MLIRMFSLSPKNREFDNDCSSRRREFGLSFVMTERSTLGIYQSASVRTTRNEALTRTHFVIPRSQERLSSRNEVGRDEVFESL